MKIKVKKPEIPVALFKVDREKLIPCYIPEFEGDAYVVHALISLILNSIDINDKAIYDTQQMAEELCMLQGESMENVRYKMEKDVAMTCFKASQLGLFDYEYLGDDKDDYGHYITFFKSPKNKKGN